MTPEVLMLMGFAAGVGETPVIGTATSNMQREQESRRPSYGYGFGYRKAVLWLKS